MQFAGPHSPSKYEVTVRWCQSQIDQGRPVVVQNFGTVGYSQVRENLNVIYTKLSP